MGKKSSGSAPLIVLIVGVVTLLYVGAIGLFFANGLTWTNEATKALLNNPSIFTLAFGGNLSKYITDNFPSVTGVVWMFALQVVLMVFSLVTAFCTITGRMGGKGTVFSMGGLALIAITNGVLSLNIKNLVSGYDKYAGLLGYANLGVGAIIYAVVMFIAATLSIFMVITGLFGTQGKR